MLQKGMNRGRVSGARSGWWASRVACETVGITIGDSHDNRGFARARKGAIHRSHAVEISLPGNAGLAVKSAPPSGGPIWLAASRHTLDWSTARPREPWRPGLSIAGPGSHTGMRP